MGEQDAGMEERVASKEETGGHTGAKEWERTGETALGSPCAAGGGRSRNEMNSS